MKHEHELLTQYLDGELPREALPPELQAEADAFRGMFEGLRRERIAAPPWVRTAVMGRVRATARSRWRDLFGWLVTPKLVPLSPVTAMVVLAAGVAIAAAVRYRPSTPSQVAAQVQDGRVMTRFIFLAPEASSVAVTGDFVDWKKGGIPLQRDPSGNGMWVGVVRLKPGVHQYVFVVDGTEWRPDPNAPQLSDGYGQKNSMLLVPQIRS
jgi:hypothetical protein